MICTNLVIKQEFRDVIGLHLIRLNIGQVVGHWRSRAVMSSSARWIRSTINQDRIQFGLKFEDVGFVSPCRYHAILPLQPLLSPRRMPALINACLKTNIIAETAALPTHPAACPRTACCGGKWVCGPLKFSPAETEQKGTGGIAPVRQFRAVTYLGEGLPRWCL